MNHKEVTDELAWIGTYLHYIKESSVPIDWGHVKLETQKDKLLKRVYTHIMCGWPNILSDGDKELYRRSKIYVHIVHL